MSLKNEFIRKKATLNDMLRKTSTFIWVVYANFSYPTSGEPGERKTTLHVRNAGQCIPQI
jgi:hypothetical protein